MEKKKYQIRVNDEVREYEEGTSFEDIAKDFQNQYTHQIVLGCENYKLFELHKQLKKDCTLKFITTGDAVGNKTYKRSMCLMLVKAIHDVSEHKETCKVRIDFSVDKGFYCTVQGIERLNQEFLDAVKARMMKMIEEAMPIEKRTVHTDDAIA